MTGFLSIKTDATRSPLWQKTVFPLSSDVLVVHGRDGLREPTTHNPCCPTATELLSTKGVEKVAGGKQIVEVQLVVATSQIFSQIFAQLQDNSLSPMPTSVEVPSDGLSTYTLKVQKYIYTRSLHPPLHTP